jgi:hypothetical protein
MINSMMREVYELESIAADALERVLFSQERGK